MDKLSTRALPKHDEAAEWIQLHIDCLMGEWGASWRRFAQSRPVKTPLGWVEWRDAVKVEVIASAGARDVDPKMLLEALAPPHPLSGAPALLLGCTHDGFAHEFGPRVLGTELDRVWSDHLKMRHS